MPVLADFIAARAPDVGRVLVGLLLATPLAGAASGALTGGRVPTCATPVEIVAFRLPARPARRADWPAGLRRALQVLHRPIPGADRDARLRPAGARQPAG